MRWLWGECGGAVVGRAGPEKSDRLPARLRSTTLESRGPVLAGPACWYEVPVTNLCYNVGTLGKRGYCCGGRKRQPGGR
ncbi:hypothetical protein E2C01_094695 [Portunus trituberculatus]|uniref:Uncharacterized protein n=1 Tax=Portunus trituberculatus TaxID=210409 RepID=A0A5B7JR51_PORTR|nr:hypothetical protein [Portunus trituberculatus]